MQKNIKQLNFFLTIFLIKLTLDFGYVFFVSPVFSYAGFSYDFNLLKYIFSFLFLFLYSFTIDIKMSRPSDFYMYIIFSSFLLPLFSFYALANKPTWPIILIILSVLIIDITRRLKPISFSPITTRHNLVALILFCLIILITLLSISNGGLKNLNLNFYKIYELRDENSEILSVGILGYLNNWMWKIFGISLLCFSLHRKNFVYVSMMLVFFVFWFAMSGHKSVLFYPFMVISIWYIFMNNQNVLNKINIAIIFIISLSLIMYAFFDSLLPSSLFLRRVFFVVSNNTFDYFIYFSDNPKVYWSNSFITFGLLDYPYTSSPADMIGELRGSDSHVNNGFFSTGYMHAGILGLFVYSVIVGFIFNIIDGISKNGVPFWFTICLTIVSIRALILSSDLLTALVTHGIIISIIVLFLFKGLSSSDES